MTIALALLTGLAGWVSALACDSTLAPIDGIPKLSESFEQAGYKDILARRSLLPDRIDWDSCSIRVRMTEKDLIAGLPAGGEIAEGPQQRSRAQQWQFIRELLAQDNSSMHYYILADAYYRKQLCGWFKTYELAIEGIGRLIIYLHANAEDGTYRIWLLRLRPDPMPVDGVKYAEGLGLTLTRSGNPEIRWDIERNRVSLKNAK